MEEGGGARRTKGSGAREDQGRVGWRLGGPKAPWAAPGRTNVAWGGAQKDQGRVGWRPVELRSRGPAPKRTKGALGGAQED